MDNRNVFSRNLRYLMEENKKSRQDISTALGVSYFTITSWVNGTKYPRMDKVEKLANYLGVLKSDLIEEKTEEHREMQKKNDALTDIIIEMRTDDEFLSIVEAIYKMDKEKRSSLLTFLK